MHKATNRINLIRYRQPSIVTLTVLLIAVSVLSSCRTPQTIIQHHTDTLRVETIRYDSIDRHHTHIIRQQGDTLHLIDSIFIDHYHTLYRDSIHLVHDTTTRTIFQTEQIEQRLTLWQRIKLWAFYPLLLVAIIISIYIYIRIR